VLLDDYGSLSGLTTQVGIAHTVVGLELLNRTLELGEARRATATNPPRAAAAIRLRSCRLLQLKERRRSTRLRARSAGRGLANRGRPRAGGADGPRGALRERSRECGMRAVSRCAAGAARTSAALDGKLAAVLPMLEEASIQVREAGAVSWNATARPSTSMRHARTRSNGAWRRSRKLSRKHRVCTARSCPSARPSARRRGLDGLERAELESRLGAHRARRPRCRAYRAPSRRSCPGKREPRGAHPGSRHLRAHADARHVRWALRRWTLPRHGNADPRRATASTASSFRVTANPGQTAAGRLAKGRLGGASWRACRSGSAGGRARAQATRCMVFDEVGTPAIGGAGWRRSSAASCRALGARGQVLCVTHLPQVACQAHHHLRGHEAHRTDAPRGHHAHRADGQRSCRGAGAAMLGGRSKSPPRRASTPADMLAAMQAPTRAAAGAARRPPAARGPPSCSLPRFAERPQFGRLAAPHKGSVSGSRNRKSRVLCATAVWRSSIPESMNSSTRPQSWHTMWVVMGPLV